MKKIAIVGIVGLPAQYGGFESFTEQLVLHLENQFSFTVYCQKNAYKSHPSIIRNVHLKYIPLKANGFQSILYDIISILDSLKYADSILVLGVSGCLILPILRLFCCHRKFIVNVDGIEWKRKKWTFFAKTFLRFSEYCAVKFADIIIADNQVIVDYIHKTYHRTCTLIEYGADNKQWEQ